MQLKPAPISSVAPTVGIYFDTRRATQENKYPVKIRVIFTVGYKKWLQRYYPTIIAHLAAYELPCAGTEATREPSHTCKASHRTRQTYPLAHMPTRWRYNTKFKQ